METMTIDIRQMLCGRDVVYIPYKDMVVALRLCDAKDVLDELDNYGTMNEFVLEELREQAERLYFYTKAWIDVRPPGSMQSFLFDLLCDVMNLYVATYILRRERIDFLSEEAQCRLSRMKPLSLSDAANPNTRLEAHLADAGSMFSTTWY